MCPMVNQRLRNALTASETTPAALAERCGVDRKSVERWITQDRIPHPATRSAVSRTLGMDETYFWPSLLRTDRTKNATESELVQVWPTRDTVPGDVWHALLDQTERQLDILVYAGGFLVEAYHLVDVIAAKAAAGVAVRVLVGDSRCEAVHQRGREEGLPALADRCQSTLEYLSEVTDAPGVAIRTHQTVLYASEYRFDDSMLVNNHGLRLLGCKITNHAPQTRPRRPPLLPLHRRLRASLGHRAAGSLTRMGERFDYYDDPAAPKANSVRPSAAAFVRPRRRTPAHPTIRQRQLVHARRGPRPRRVAHSRRYPGDQGRNRYRRPSRSGSSESSPIPNTSCTTPATTKVRQEFTIVYRADYRGRPN